MTTVSGAVASGHPAATAAAVDLLHAGASAVDAAIAADAVMGVVEPIATGIGGDVMAIVAKVAGTEAYNGAGRTGRSLTHADVVSSDHGYVPSLGGTAVTVPGAVRAWWDLHQRHGRVPWARLFDAAIEAATDGVAVGAVAARTWAAQSSRLDEAGRHLYLRDGDAPRAGSTWRNPDLATLLALIANDGPSAFYDSDVATAIARAVNSAGGRMDAADIVGHQGQWVSPHITFVDGMTIATVPPPCQGMVVGLAARLLAEDGRLGDLSPKGHLCLLESLDRAFSVATDEVYDRSPESVPEVDRLVAMARERRLGGAMPYGPGTVFTAAADAETMVALVSSVCDRFGSGVTVPGHGFVLGSRARGFCLDPSHPNVVAPAKRPYHSIVPTVISRDGRPWLSLGVVGGIMQPQGQLQILTRMLAGAMIDEAIAAPRLRLLGDGVVAVEDEIDRDIRSSLESAYELAASTGVDFGGAQAVLRTSDGLDAGTDPRKDGHAEVL